jgi:hypothetical protein
MIKQCQKEDCYEPAIRRGKYCELHRTGKIKQKKDEAKSNYEEDINLAMKLSLQMLDKERIEEERKLKIDQDNEYLDTVRIDMERIEKEKKRVEDIESKRLNTLKNETLIGLCYFNIKIKLPFQTLLKKFNDKCKLKDIRDYLDVYFEDNKINIKNYNLVINQNPIRRLSIENNNLDISSLNLGSNFILFLENLDA